jgi:hypothetical protein
MAAPMSTRNSSSSSTSSTTPGASSIGLRVSGCSGVSGGAESVELELQPGDQAAPVGQRR